MVVVKVVDGNPPVPAPSPLLGKQRVRPVTTSKATLLSEDTSFEFRAFLLGHQLCIPFQGYLSKDPDVEYLSFAGVLGQQGFSVEPQDELVAPGHNTT